MRFHCYEQQEGGPSTHVATWETARVASDWLKDRLQQLEAPDLYTKNPVVRAYFAEGRLKNGETITWTLQTRPYHLSVIPE